ncbi:hypothetical protein EV128_1256 [Rhizobium azibense]|nr:hypothetical protein EV128_1256 [Rhizobium azibense]
MPHYLTLARENEFQFNCPVFNANTKMAACMALREAVWMGKTVEKRQGCQAAMNCGMCPAAAIVSKINYSRTPVSDDYGSKEPKVGKLHADILERIRNIIPIPRELGRFALTDNERELLNSTRGRIEAQLKTAPGASGKETAFVEPRRSISNITTTRRPLEAEGKRTVVQKTTQNQAINNAAKTGDMAAAINAAAA